MNVKVVPRVKTQQVISIKFLLILGGFAGLGALSTNIILPIFPKISAEMHITQASLSSLLSSFFLVFAIGQLIVGPLSDRIGRQPVILFGLSTFILGSVLAIFASNFEALIFARMIQGLGVSATSVLFRSIARDLFEGETLAKVLALTMVVLAAAPGFSPLIGGVLDYVLNWHAVFYFIIFLAVVLGFFYLKEIGETLLPEQRVQLKFIEILKSYKQVFFTYRFMIPTLAVSFIYAALYTYFSLAPSILMQQLGLTSLEMGSFFAFTVFIVFAASISVPKLSIKIHPKKIALLGCVFAILGGVLMHVQSSHLNLWGFSLSISIFLFGMGLCSPIGTALALQPFAHKAGLASSLFGFIQMGMAALTVSLSVQLMHLVQYPLNFILITFSVIALVLFYLTDRFKDS